MELCDKNKTVLPPVSTVDQHHAPQYIVGLKHKFQFALGYTVLCFGSKWKNVKEHTLHMRLPDICKNGVKGFQKNMNTGIKYLEISRIGI